MAVPLKVDFVSDVSCPWCAIGLAELDRALIALRGEIDADLEFQPFELNPGLAADGVDAAVYLADKLGASPAELAAAEASLAERGRTVGFGFRFDRRTRIYNTFAAHRLLYWARAVGGDQPALKRALLTAYFGEGADLSSTPELAKVAGSVGLDADEAGQLLAGDRYAPEVRDRQRYYAQRGIAAVPSIILAGKFLVQGGQPSAVFQQVLRQAAHAAGSGIS